MTDDLALCPFCGGKASFEQVEPKMYGNARWTVGCNERENATGIKGHDEAAGAILCYAYQSLTTFATKREAAEAWNRRSSPSTAGREWLPIESAPKDGTAVWLWCDDAQYIGYFQAAEAAWDKTPGQWFLKAGVRPKAEHQRYTEIFGTYAYDASPTMWQPIPAPPGSPTETEHG